MTITEYYEESNYKINKVYNVPFATNEDITVEDFYNNCIAVHTSNVSYINNAIKWHNMLVDYAEDKDAVLWVRYHENGPKDKFTGRYKTRRACKTVFQDGFSYVFVSNYDAHEIFNMVRLGVEPDLNEFKNLMNSHKYRLHFDQGGKCEESDICAYPNIGTIKGGVLTTQNLYLAHIIGVKSEAYIDRKTKKMIEIDTQKLYPAGDISDWGKKAGVNVRELDYSLSQDEKEIVKAHFLRFVSPLNYYVLPGKDYQKSRFKGQIGENTYMNNCVREKYNIMYGALYNDFVRMAMAPKINEIFISYWPKAKKSYSKSGKITNACKTPIAGSSGGASSPAGKSGARKYTNDDMYKEAAYYLQHEVGLPKVEKNILGLDGSGNTAQNHLHKLGIDTSRTSEHKGLLMHTDIDDAIANATDPIFKNTLEEIKKRDLYIIAE